MGMFDSLFGGAEDPSKDAMKYLNKVPGTVTPYFDPFIQAGQRQLPGLENQYNQLMNDPGARMNQIGAGYQKSPGYDFALQQALQASANGQAAGGMAGSPQHEQQNMTLATNLANQDYNQYLTNALGLYGQGMKGSQSLYDTGFGASNTLADMLANNLASQANLSYSGAANKNTANSGFWGGLMGLGGSLGSSYMLSSALGGGGAAAGGSDAAIEAMLAAGLL